MNNFLKNVFLFVIILLLVFLSLSTVSLRNEVKELRSDMKSIVYDDMIDKVIIKGRVKYLEIQVDSLNNYIEKNK